MSLLLVGVNHRVCPLEIRERLAVLGAKAASERLAAEGWGEVVVLATCNRFELYAASDLASLDRLTFFLDRFSGMGVSSYAYRLAHREAVGHLFGVTSGLDSLVLGETEILGQVKQAYEAARDAGTTGKLTNVLFQRALFVGKAVRSRTTIAMGQVSVASAAVELARRIFGRINQSEVLILGAGEMAEKTARHLISAKAARICLANRTAEKARLLARSLSHAGASDSSRACEISAVDWEDFPERMRRADIVVASTGASEPVVTRRHVENACSGRRGRSLFLIDIAMPRDVAEDVGDMDGVYLYTMADLQTIVDENISRRAGEIDTARDIVNRESAESAAWLDSCSSGAPFSFRHGAARLPAPKEAPSG